MQALFWAQEKIYNWTKFPTLEEAIIAIIFTAGFCDFLVSGQECSI